MKKYYYDIERDRIMVIQSKPKISALYRTNKPVFSLFLDGKEIDQIYRTNKLKDAISDRLFLKLLDQNVLKQIKVERLKTI